MQKDVLIVEREDQVRGLQDAIFLGRFLEPASPSDVARDLGIAPNLAHHHARRHAELDLLFEAKREGGKVYYQLTAKTFKHDRRLLPVGDPDEPTAVTLRQLAQRFLAAQERSERLEGGEDPSWHFYRFSRDRIPAEETWKSSVEPLPDAYPAHFQVRTLALSSTRYRELARRIADFLVQAEADDPATEKACTLAFIAFHDPLHNPSNDSHYLSTYLPANEPGEGPGPWDL